MVYTLTILCVSHLCILFCISYKPVQMVHIVAPLKEEFEELFRATFSLKQNAHFLASVQVCYFVIVHWRVF